MTIVTPFSRMLALCLFILFPILAFYLGTVSHGMNESNPPLAALSPTLTPAPTDSTVWGTYINLRYGFSFHYPTYLSLTCCDVAGSLSESAERILVFADKQSATKEKKPFDGLGIYIDPNPSHLSLSEYTDREYASFYRAYPRFSGDLDNFDINLKKTSIQLGPYNAVSIQGAFDYPYENIYVAFPDNQRILIFSRLLKNSSSPFLFITQRMFSSFQFLSPAVVNNYNKIYQNYDPNTADFSNIPYGVVFDSSSSALLDKQ